MKYLIVLSIAFISFFSFSQSEKGCTIKDGFNVHYKGERYTSLTYAFSEIWPSTSTDDFSKQDTFRIVVNDTKEIVMYWWFFSEKGYGYFPDYDTVQWYLNDTLLKRNKYSFSKNESNGFCGTKYSAGTSIYNVEPGFYQLRYLGEGSTLIATDFPVIHVDEQEPASIISQNDRVISKLYPNPIEESVFLEVAAPIEEGVLKVYNIQGKVVKSIPLKNVHQISELDVSQLDKGLYIFSVVDLITGREILRKKIVKK